MTLIYEYWHISMTFISLAGFWFYMGMIELGKGLSRRKEKN